MQGLCLDALGLVEDGKLRFRFKEKLKFSLSLLALGSTQLHSEVIWDNQPQQ